MKNKPSIIVAGFGMAFLLVWLFVITPQLTNSDDVFEMSSQNIGEIQFADEVGMELSEPIKMMFVWNTDVVEKNGDEITFHTIYDYKDILTDESLWVTEFDETANKFTRQYTDKDGYVMFPSNLEQKDYDVYDIGGTVLDFNFIGVDEIDGLEVYKFSGETTFDISHVYPDLSEQIFEDYSATNYIEPVTGLEVASTEEFTDYAIVNGEKMIITYGWDGPTEFSQDTLVQKAKGLKALFEIYHIHIPTIIVLFTLISCLLLLSYSKIKNSEEKLKLLQTTDKQKDELASMMSHEIKNPLTPILSVCEILLSEKAGKLSQEQREKIKIIEKNSNQINDLLSDFTEVKKLELDQMSLSKTNVDLKEYLENVVESVRPFTGEKKVRLHLKLKDTWKITCDQKRISQVLSNLIKNSIDFVPENDGQIIISAEQSDDGTIISVEDNGIGITPSESETIFDKFKQLHSPSSIKHDGTGLGLSSWKGMVEAHGGKIWLDKEFDKGARFRFLIPKS